ncbi:MAG: domain S-box protein [Fibrobacteres bacterium]|nr:domain S-box protein [Fibrobacterota bacterium]
MSFEGNQDQSTGLSLEQLETILERIDELVGVMKVEAPGRYRILAANHAYFANSPKTRDQLIGKLLEEWLSPEGFRVWDAKAREVLAFNRSIHFESTSYTLSTPQTLEQHWTPIKDKEGNVTHILVVARNITELKRVQERLRQSEKMEAVGQLAGGIAHDFNNLLTAINGFAYLALTRKDIPDDLREYIDGIRRSGERAAALTSQLLAYSRKTVLLPSLMNMNSAVAEMEKILRRLIHENISVAARLQPDLGLVKVDPGQMSQVILNLAVNARDAMPHGGHLNLETANVKLPGPQDETPGDAPAGAYVMLAVKDNGSGMSPEVRDRIFEPFFTTKEAGSGTGLGLSSVYGIVKQSGGYITVQSKSGLGSIFRIFLPMAVPAGVASPAAATLEATPGGKESVLLVEDEEPVRTFVKRALELLGYTVHETGDSEKALADLDAGLQVNLLITDMIMPGMAGTKLAERARARCPGLKVLYISGYADHSLVRQALSEKGAQFLQKPFSPAQLSQIVRQVLDK